jgi:hypothetical protein
MVQHEASLEQLRAIYNFIEAVVDAELEWVLGDHLKYERDMFLKKTISS